MKRCSKCKLELELDQFTNKASMPDGKRSACRACTNAYLKTYRDRGDVRERRRAYARDRFAKKNALIMQRLVGGCIDCDEKDVVVLEFDHLGDKLGNVAVIRKNGTITELIEELKKCVVRCANCHRRKTARDYGSWKLEA